MPNYLIFTLDMLNGDSRKYGTAYFYCEDERGGATEQDIEKIRQFGNDDIWNQTWMVKCADKMEMLKKKRELMEAQEMTIN